ncbi:MAG: rod shape-determining protein MreC [Peptococcaceae bacterium]
MPRPPLGKILLLLTILIFLLIILKVTAKDELTSPAKIVRDVLAPVSKVTMQTGQAIRNVLKLPVSLAKEVKQNRELKEKVSRLEEQLREANEYRLENRRLKELLDFKETKIKTTKVAVYSAAVIGRDLNNWFGTITVNKGAREGLKVNMTVITPAGLIGRVISVSQKTAEVLLITDPRSGVSCLIQENRAPGLVEGMSGNTNQLQMIHIPTDFKIHKDQVVITSGLSGLYPYGLSVGRIKKVNREPSGLFFKATIQPFVDFNRLEEVLIIFEK